MSVGTGVKTRFRNMLRRSSSSDRSKSSTAADAQDVAATESGRNVSFDVNNELTRRQALKLSLNNAEAVLEDHETSAYTVPRRRRDSKVSFVEPGSTRRLSTSSGLSVPLQAPRLSSENGEGRRMSLGPSMDKWRLEEEEHARYAPRDSPSPSIVSQKPRLSFSQNSGRRMSLGPAMEQWRLEEDEERRSVEATSDTTSELSVPTPTSRLGLPLQRPMRSSFGQVDGRRMSLGPAMEEWRLENDDGSNLTSEGGNEDSSAFLQPITAQALSKRPLRSSFSQEDGRRGSLGPAMERWRLEEEDENQEAPLTSESRPPVVSTSSAWPRSGKGQNEKRLMMNLDTAMEKWRQEQMEGAEGHKLAADAPLTSVVAVRPVSKRPPRNTTNQMSTLGPAMEAWRLEEACC